MTLNGIAHPANSPASPVHDISFIVPIGHFYKLQPGQEKVFQKVFNHNGASGKHLHGTATLPDWTRSGAMYRFPLRKNAVETCPDKVQAQSARFCGVINSTGRLP